MLKMLTHPAWKRGAPVLQFGMIIVAAVLTQPEQDINLADCCFIVFLCCVKNFMA